MEFLIWIGAATSLVGLAGILWCIYAVWTAKRDCSDDEALRARIRKMVPLNAAALLLSVIGLMLVVTGVLLSS